MITSDAPGDGIDNPEEIAEQFVRAARASTEAESAVNARSAALQSQLDELNLPGCDVQIGLKASGVEIRSARVNTFGDLSDEQWARFAEFLHHHDVTGLDVSGAPRTDLDFLVNFPWLTAFSFAEDVTNIDGLSFLTDRLISLSWGANRKFSLKVLEKFPYLQTLGVGPGKDFEVLSGLTELRWLGFGDSGLPTLDVIAGLPNLRLVSMGEGKPPDLSVLTSLPQLQILDFSQWRNLRDGDLAPIADCLHLKIIEL